MKIGFIDRFVISAETVIVADVNNFIVSQIIFFTVKVKRVIFIKGLRCHIKGGRASHENAVVRILDSKDDIIRKFKRAVTDSGNEICTGEGKDGISNLLSIYSCFSGKTVDEAIKEFEGKGYGEFKLAVGEACADALAPVREEFNRLMADKAYLEEVMKQGASDAYRHARKTLSKVRRKIGFTELKF